MYLRKKKGINRVFVIVILIAVAITIAVVFLAAVFTGTTALTTPLPQKIVEYGNSTVNVFTVYLFNGSVSVDASYFDYSPFNVTAGAMNVTVTGNFTASGGSGNDIEVYIMNTTQYDNWYNGNTTSVYYDSGRVTTSKISLKLPAGQSYYLILDNNFSSISSKMVSGEIILTFTQPTTTTETTTVTASPTTGTTTGTVTITSTVTSTITSTQTTTVTNTPTTTTTTIK
ncbi:MAG: emp24/gp25L/p24 family protein [Nitrososphaeria archaeon]